MSTSSRESRALVRSEIEELVVEHAYLLDHGRFAEIVDLYTDDCEVTRTLPPFTTAAFATARGKAALAATFADPASFPANPRTMRHVLTNLRFERIGEDAASALHTWSGYRHEGPGIGVAHPMAVGDYEDEYRRGGDGRWRIHRRKIVIAFLNQDLLEVARANIMADKFELASKAWFDELFRLFRAAAAEHPEIEFSVCEVFTNVPDRLSPDAKKQIAWRAFIAGGKADLAMGEVDADAVDIKTIADWEHTVPFARMKIDITNPADFARYMQLADEAAAAGHMQRFGDRTKAPLEMISIHNTLADRTA